MKSLAIFSTGLLAMTLTGCATQKGFTYNQGASLAMNVANASGMGQGLKDAELPKDSLKDENTKQVAMGVAAGAAGLSSPVGGLTNAQAGALNLASWLISPGIPATQPAVVAWMPNTGQTAEEAQNQLGELLAGSAEKLFKELNTEVKTSKASYNSKLKGVTLDAKGEKVCSEVSKDKACYIGFLTAIPEKVKSTMPFQKTGESYLFRNEIGFHTSIVLPKNQNNGLTDMEFMLKLSSGLPEWVFLYYPPDTLKMDSSGKKVAYPLFLNQGKEILFLKP